MQPDRAARQAETQQRKRLQHEWFLNSVIERRNPGIEPTPRYQRGALPGRDARFYSQLDYLRYLTRREMGKFDPEIDYPTAPPRAPHTAPACPPKRGTP